VSLGPDYRKLWSSSAVSNLSDGIFFVALPLIAVRLTDSPLLVGGSRSPADCRGSSSCSSPVRWRTDSIGG
jgi:hypothetical protein